MNKALTIVFTLIVNLCVVAFAQENVAGGPEIDPQATLDSTAPPKATINGLTGPTEAVGIMIEPQGALDLGEIFPLAEADGRLYRGRKIFVAPGGIVPIHSHEGRPAITFVAEGEIVEYRSDADGPIDHKTGDATFDKGGVSQWWENNSDAMAVLLVVDILPPDGKGDDDM